MLYNHHHNFYPNFTKKTFFKQILFSDACLFGQNMPLREIRQDPSPKNIQVFSSSNSSIWLLYSSAKGVWAQVALSEEVSSFLNMHHIYFPLQALGTITIFSFLFFLHNKYLFVLIIAGEYLSVCSMILAIEESSTALQNRN